MISKSATTLLFAVSFVMSAGVAEAQLLAPVSVSETTSITVGTTTHDVTFPAATLRSAADRLRDILYYLRTFDSPVVPIAVPDTTVIPEVVGTSDIYSDIADTVFVDSVEDTTSAIEVINTVAQGCHVFGQSLEIGDQGPEVLELQRFLNGVLDAPIATSGPGSPGEETDYFGSLTFAAVFAYQNLYADAVLRPLGLLNPTGYWGPSTIAHANSLTGCSDQ